MPRIMTKCPNTDRDVSTVHRMSQSQLDELKGEFSFRCPVCESVHRWDRTAAWVEPGLPKAPMVA
jgi:hypothetical protein